MQPSRVLCLLVLTLWSHAAAAREPRSAIAPLTTGQGAPADVQRVFADELPRALTAAGFVLMPPNEVDMRVGERPDFLQCQSSACLTDEAAYLRVGRLALPRLVRAPDGSLSLGISIFDAAQKRTLSDAVDKVASAAEVPDKLRALAARLRADLDKPGRLEVQATPAAALAVDGETKGRTPWSGELSAGEHVVTLEAGGERVERDVNVAPGGTAHIDVQLAATAAAPAAGEHVRSRALKPLKWATLAAGVLAVGGGAALMAIDGRGSCIRASGQRQCPELFDTLAAGAATAAIGGALVVTSVILFVLDRPRR